jgi:hypothetical protein
VNLAMAYSGQGKKGIGNRFCRSGTGNRFCRSGEFKQNLNLMKYCCFISNTGTFFVFVAFQCNHIVNNNF